MDALELMGLPRYVIAFLHQMGPHGDHLKWNIAEATHKITLTLTWNFQGTTPVAQKRHGLTKSTGLWAKLQRKLRLPIVADTEHDRAETIGSVPRTVTEFLRQTATERAECACKQANCLATSVVGTKSRGWTEALRDLRHKRRLRSSLSLPDKIMGIGEAPLKKDCTVVLPTSSYPSTPIRLSPLQGNGRPPPAQSIETPPLPMRSRAKTLSWPRFGDIVLFADPRAVRTVEYDRPPIDRQSGTRMVANEPPDKIPSSTDETGARARGEEGEIAAHKSESRWEWIQQPTIFIHGASPEGPSMTDNDVTYPAAATGQEATPVKCTQLSPSRHASVEEASSSPPRDLSNTVNQTVLKCLDSCDKILFRHSTTIT